MLLFIHSVLFILVQAEVDYTKANNLAELKQMSQQEEINQSYKQICEAELRDILVPVHCYMWLERVELTDQKRQFFTSWLNQKCVLGLSEDTDKNSYAYSFLTKIKEGPCKVRVLQSAKVWLYKKGIEGGAENLNSPKIGKKFENILENEVSFIDIPDKISNHRVLR